MFPPSGMKPRRGVEVQAAAEAEVVLEDVAQRPPARLGVHELDAALDDVGVGRVGTGVDVGEQVGVRPRPRRRRRRRFAACTAGSAVFSALGLFFVPLASTTTVRAARGRRRVGDRLRAGVVVPDDHEDLERGVAERGEPVERDAEHRSSWRAGKISENDRVGSVPVAGKRIASIPSGVRHAHSIHASVVVATTPSTIEAMTTKIPSAVIERAPPVARTSTGGSAQSRRELRRRR